MKKYLLLTLLAFSGCSTIEKIYTDVPKQVALLEASLATAEHAANVYVTLPVCGKTGAVLCRTPDMTKKIGAADNAAYIAVEAARQAETEDALGAAQTALTALQALTTNLPGV